MLIPHNPQFRNLWMFPRNVRFNWPLETKIRTQCLRKVLSKSDWNQSTQDAYMSELEKLELKKGAITKQVKNSGGARTYVSQLELLGLIFGDQNSKFLTIAGEAMADGDDETPVDILRHQLLNMQFPSPYSLSQNVKINPEIRVKPVQFILKLLSDPEINTLSDIETIFPVIYGHNMECIPICKDKIISFRNLELSNKTVDQQLIGVRKLINSFKDVLTIKATPKLNETELDYIFRRLRSDLRDIANTLKCYMESAGLIEIHDEETHKRYSLPPNMKKWSYDRVKTYRLDKFLDLDSDGYEIFQRRYGSFTKTKDTRRKINLKENYALSTVKDTIRQEFLYLFAGSNPTSNDIDRFIVKTEGKYNYTRDQILAYIPQSSYSNHADSSLYSLSVGGKNSWYQFEVALAQWIKNEFAVETCHTGQKRIHDQSFSDVFIRFTDNNCCGIVDAKSIPNGYTLPKSDRRAMESYAKNIDYLKKPSEELSFVGFVCGEIGSNKSGLRNHLNDLEDEINVPAFLIDTKELTITKNKYNGSHDSLIQFFSKSDILTSNMY